MNRLPDILKAAERRFVKHGTAKTTLDEIARDLRIAKSTVYHYFDSKEALFLAVVKKQINDYFTELREIFNNEEKKFPDRFRSYFYLKANLKTKYKLIYGMMLAELAENTLQGERELLESLLKDEEQLIKLVFTAYFNDALNTPKDDAPLLFVMQTNMLPFLNDFYLSESKTQSESLMQKMLDQFELLLNSLNNY
ncbi:MAG: TetR/AcrR family transcriptional regulator [Bacteroidetes bacterium]|nr:TetR/AcrR family transcriptional regulator [Bacteroidota bacterium]